MLLSKLSLERDNFAFLKINREVDNHLKKSLTEIKAILCPILVIKASDLGGDYELFNATDGNTITSSKEDVYVVLDGQHRVKTALNLLREATNYCKSEEQMAEKGQVKVKKDLIAITDVLANVIEKEDLHDLNIGSYIRAINSTSKNWNGSDYIKSMCETKDQDVVTKTYKAFEALGMSITSISLYLTGKKCTNRVKIVNHLDNKVGLGISNTACIRAIKMYIAMRRVGFSKKFLSSRYMPCVLHEYEHTEVLEEKMKHFGNLTKENVTILEDKAKNSDNDFTKEVTQISKSDYNKANPKYETLWDDVTDDNVQDFLDGGYNTYIEGYVPCSNPFRNVKADSGKEKGVSDEHICKEIAAKMKLNKHNQITLMS